MNKNMCPDAIANITGENGKNPCGQVKFYQKKNCVIVSVNIKGLPQWRGVIRK